jgi:hypothetical protein
MPDIELRDGTEAAHASHGHLDAALVHRGHRAFHGQSKFGRLCQLGPCLGPARHRAPQDHAALLAHGFHHARLDVVADLDGQIAVLVTKFVEADHAVACTTRDFHHRRFLPETRHAAAHTVAHLRERTTTVRVSLLELGQHGSKILILLNHGYFHTRSTQSMHAKACTPKHAFLIGEPTYSRPDRICCANGHSVDGIGDAHCPRRSTMVLLISFLTRLVAKP